MREDKSGDPHNQKQAQLITGKKCNKKTRHQKQGESTNQKYSADKSPLFANGGEDVVVVDSSSGQEAELNLRVCRFKSLARPAA